MQKSKWKNEITGWFIFPSFPPKPGLRPYFKSQPQIQLWCLHPNLEHRPDFRPDGEEQRWGEVKRKQICRHATDFWTRLNMCTCICTAESWRRSVLGISSSVTAEAVWPWSRGYEEALGGSPSIDHQHRQSGGINHHSKKILLWSASLDSVSDQTKRTFCLPCYGLDVRLNV